MISALGSTVLLLLDKAQSRWGLEIRRSQQTHKVYFVHTKLNPPRICQEFTFTLLNFKEKYTENTDVHVMDE